tara:strand:- start:466 stop:1140 length:675 start_codon:yes stop_codon:yes gene_type:complete
MKTFMDIREGVYDPNIFKAFFIAGGPGSGKSFVVKRTTGGLGMKIVNSDPAFEKMLKDAGYSTDISDLDPTVRDTIRGKAKAVTKKRRDSFVDGRLGLIIDGTGKDYDKITRQATELKQLGYDTYMIFVNTSLDVALARNRKRDRVLADSMVIQLWNQVQQNLGKFSQYFRRNLVIVDNNEEQEDDGQIFNSVFKQIKPLAKSKPTSKIAQLWIKKELEMKRRR